MPSKPGTSPTNTLRSRQRQERIDAVIRLLLDLENPLTTKVVVDKLAAGINGLEKVCVRQAYFDVKEAWLQIARLGADDKAVLFTRADHAWQRREAIADKKGDSQAGNYALDRWTKLHGLYAPKKVELSGSISVGVQLRGIVGVLDERGIEALGVVMEQIERARAAGLLPEATSVDGDDGDDGDEDQDELVEAPARPPAKKR